MLRPTPGVRKKFAFCRDSVGRGHLHYGVISLLSSVAVRRGSELSASSRAFFSGAMPPRRDGSAFHNHVDVLHRLLHKESATGCCWKGACRSMAAPLLISMGCLCSSCNPQVYIAVSCPIMRLLSSKKRVISVSRGTKVGMHHLVSQGKETLSSKKLPCHHLGSFFFFFLLIKMDRQMLYYINSE